MSIRPGTSPTTASDDGSESIPLLTISAIMSTATSGHESVLYRIYTRAIARQFNHAQLIEITIISRLTHMREELGTPT